MIMNNDMKYRILALVLAVLFASCEKETKNDCDTTKVFFYTNAQIVTNCGDFNVDVYIDEEYKGTLQTAYSADETSILCNEKVEDGSLLTVNLKQGKHTYKAIPDCVENRVFYGEFKIEFSECQSVFIDLLNSEHVKTDTKANIFELFTIKIPNGYSYSATCGDDSQIFSMYSNEGDVHFFAEYSPMIQKDTLYEAKAEYVRNFRLPQTDSIIRCQTYPIREIIEQNGSVGPARLTLPFVIIGQLRYNSTRSRTHVRESDSN